MSRTRFTRFISAAWSVASVSTALAVPPRDDRAEGKVESAGAPVELEGLVIGRAAEFDLPGLAEGIVVQLGVANVAGAGGRVHVPLMDRKTVALDLTPISVRAPGYELREQLADGSWRTVDPGPENTYTGKVAGSPDAYVAASWLGEGLLANVVFPNGERHWIQPLSDLVAGAGEGLHVVYREGDTWCEGACGTPDPEPFPTPSTGSVAGTCGGDLCVAQLAVDADFEYYTARGSSSHATQDRIHAILNVMNHQYAREVGITHVLTTVLVRTAEPDPYSSATSDTLMCQFITEWTNNQTAVVRDLAKLFTGREITGSTVGQAANIGQICDNDGFCTAGLDNGAYCYSQSDFSPTFACQTDVAAHQIGHLWGAHDCNCPNSTMHTTTACVNTFANSGGVSIAEIDAHADALACLTARNDPPGNDTCTNALILAGTGAFTATNANAGTDGGALNCGSLSGNVGGGRADVFFRVTAIANGTASVDLCGSSFDTMVSVHSGCPATPANQITCNDDCGGACGVDSCTTFAATSGTTYYIRVAGYAGSTGNMTLNLSGPFTPGNNVCASAIGLFDGASLNGSLALATNDGSASCGSSATNPDVWYVFTAGECGGTLVVDACGTHDRLGQDTGMDTVISMHAACPGTTSNQLGCTDDSSPACSGDAGLVRDSRASSVLQPVEDVIVRVSHFSTALDDGFFFLHSDFTPGILAPLVASIGNDAQDCGGAYTGPAPTVTDSNCMIPVTWSLVTGPAGMTINASTGVVSWPTPAIVGSPHAITIRATNTTGFDDEAWTLTIDRMPPLIVPIANAAHNCGNAYTGPIPLLADASCMQPITSWQLVNGPTGMTINNATGVVSWPVPTPSDSPHVITIRALNSAGSDDESWGLTVDRLAPAINNIPNTSEVCDGAFTGPTPSLANPVCMLPVTWSLDDGPSGMTINAATGVLSWPSPIPDSLSTIVIRATNSEGFDQEGWRLVIEGATPVIADIPNESAQCGQEYRGPAPTLRNKECVTNVSWSLINGPVRMTIDAATGKVHWPTPNLAESGVGVLIRATSDDGFAEEGWRIRVEVQAPIIAAISNAQIPEFVAYTGPTPSLANAACTSAVTSWTLVDGAPDMTINSGSGVVEWLSPGRDASPLTVTIGAANADGSDTETWTLTVVPPVCGGSCGDFDGSGLVDLFDFAAFVECFGAAGPTHECPLELFGCADLDGNGRVDADDYVRFQARFGQTPSSTPPDCG